MQTLGIIGIGAFGEFMIRHLAPFFKVRVYDRDRDLSPVADVYNVTIVDLAACAGCDIVVLAVPVQGLAGVAEAIKPHLRKGTLVIDVCSVKIKPAEILQRLLPAEVDIVCTHPLFGPQSGRRSIAGLKITVCNVRGKKGAGVARFLAERLLLDVIETTPDQHDRELAYVQGLTHLLGKILVQLDLTEIRQTTKTFDLVMEAVGFMQHDSDQLFKAIEQENPYVTEAHERFFRAAESLEKQLGKR